VTGSHPLADDFFRLSHDDLTGWPRLRPLVCEFGLAAALLAELVLVDRLRLWNGRMWVTPQWDPNTGEPIGRPAVDPWSQAVLEQIAAEVLDEPEFARVDVRLESLRHNAYEQVANRMLQSRAVSRRVTWLRRFGRPTVVWAPIDMSSAAWPRDRLAIRVGAGKELDTGDRFLAGLIKATELGSLFAGVPNVGEYLANAVEVNPPDLQELLTHTAAAIGDAVLTYGA
jgi:hypothetical protein